MRKPYRSALLKSMGCIKYIKGKRRINKRELDRQTGYLPAFTERSNPFGDWIKPNGKKSHEY